MAERSSAADDAMLTRIGQVVMLHRGGDREEARSRFLRLWAEIGEEGDPLCRCTLAHFMAGTQDEPLDELAWDLRALSAADELAAQALVTARALYPSLHLSLAVDYAKVGRTGAAHSHLRRARFAVGVLQDGSGQSERRLGGGCSGESGS